MRESEKRSECLSSSHKEYQLSPSQTAAVTSGSGPVLVLAGPGSGKTTVITHRISYLIGEGADPSKILVVTFSRAAAAGMKQRFEKMCPQESGKVRFGTFHSVFFGILRQEEHITPADVISEEEKNGMIRRLIGKIAPDRNSPEDTEAAVREISLVRNERIPIDLYYSSSFPEEMFRRLFRDYENALGGLGKIDLDDMAPRVLKLFEEREDVLRRWQESFTHVLVDEFQDIDALQYLAVKKLALPQNNLFAVGDDDQSIYRFRGAKPEIMLGFFDDFPGAGRIELEENYRSPERVIEAAGRVIAQNTGRYDKTWRAVSSAPDSPRIIVFTDPYAESRYLVGILSKALAAGEDITDRALLVRTNMQAGFFAQQLMENQIPFTLKDKPYCIYDHWICEDLLAYMRLAEGPMQRKDLLRVMNRPNRFISRDLLTAETETVQDLVRASKGRGGVSRHILRLSHDLEFVRSLPPAAAVHYIRKGMGYDSFLAEYARQRDLKEEELLLTADELEQSAAGMPDRTAWQEHMERWRERITAQNMSGGGIVIATLHASKGLEFEEVFIPDLNEGFIPFRKARLEADIEEERRLLYVGMTRAKRRLHLWLVKERYGKVQYPSRFLRPLTDPGYRAGERHDGSSSSGSSSSSSRSASTSSSNS